MSTRYVEIDGRRFNLPTVGEMSWGELEAVEDVFGVPFESLSKTRGLLAAMWLAVRREIPSISLDDLRAIPVAGSIGDEDGPVTGTDPTDAA